METRNKTEYKTYVLYLSDMRGNVDKCVPVAVFDELEKLKNYYNSNLEVSTYYDSEESEDYFGNVHGWNKSFKRESPLEWFNPIYNNDFEVKDANNFDTFGCVAEMWIDEDPNNTNFKVPFNP